MSQALLIIVIVVTDEVHSEGRHRAARAAKKEHEARHLGKSTQVCPKPAKPNKTTIL